MIIMCAQIGLGIAFGVYKQPVQDAIIKELDRWSKDYSGLDTLLDVTTGKLTIGLPTKLRVPLGGGSNWTNEEIVATNGLNSLQMWVSIPPSTTLLRVLTV